MKIRIKNNSVRIRLTRSEVQTFGERGYVESTTPFMSGNLVYALSINTEREGMALTADFRNHTITMYIPPNMAQDWVYSEKVGFSSVMQLDNGQSLHLLLEKDFKCLDETVEDQSDNYENPLAAKK